MLPQHRYEWRRFLIPGLLCLIGFLVPLGQYYFRRFDDNGFVSWAGVFATADPVEYFSALIAAVLLAALALRVPLPSFAYTLVLFCLCCTALIPLRGVPEVNIDTSRYFMQAKHLELHGIGYFLREWGKNIPAWTDLPTVPFFYGLLLKASGESRIAIQIFVASLFAMTAVITMLIGKSLWDEETGFCAGALLLAMPYLLIQTPLMLVDVPTMFFLTLSTYLFIDAVERGGILRTAAAAGGIFLAAFCKYSVWPMLSVLPVIAAVFYFRADGGRPRQVLHRSFRVFLISFFLIGAAVALKFDAFADQVSLLMGFQRSSLGRWSESYVSIFLFQTNPVIAVAGIISLFAAMRKRDRKYLIAVWLPFLLLFFQIKRVRYILPVLPMLALMAAYGLSRLTAGKIRNSIVASAVAASLVTCYFAYAPFLKGTSAINVQHAGEFLNTLDVDAVEVFPAPEQEYPINPAVVVPILDLYTQKKILFRYEPGTSSSDEEVRRSRFRFSWAYRNPGYYETSGDNIAKKRALVLVLGRPQEPVPPSLTDIVRDFHHSKSFETYNPLFEYQTLVTIYW